MTLTGLLAYSYRGFFFSLFRQEDLTPVGKNLFELKYTHKDRPYRILIRTSPRPKLINRVTSGDGLDVTADVLPLLGPNQDFHSHLELPEGLQTLIYHTRHGTTKTFHQMFDRRD